jgi:general secretion pathway protein C
MLARLSAFASWAVVAASVMYWALRLIAAPAMAPDYTVGVDLAQRGDLARGFGVSAAPVAAAPSRVQPPAAASPASSRFKLVGVAAPRDAGSGFGLALIAIDGKAPRAIAVGRTVDEGWVLQSVSRRGARLSSNVGAETLDLEVPALALASRGIPGAAPPQPAGSPGTVRPPVALPSPATPSPQPVPGAASPGTAPQVPMSAPAPLSTVPGSPPSIFVPQEELDRARSRASDAAEQ